MNKPIFGDEAFQARLSSFLETRAKLCTHKMKYLKHAVYLVEDYTGKRYILKGMKQNESVRQQLDFQYAYSDSDIIKFVHFPNGELFLYHYDYSWLLMPFQEGKTLYFGEEQERRAAVRALKNFHLRAKGIKVTDPLIRPPLLFKWEHRLDKFRKTLVVFEAFGKDSLAKEIIKLTDRQLHYLQEKVDWYALEKTAVDQLSWTHGDVASHNFLKSKSGEIYLLDFDLLSLAPVSYDWIQLGQRFLPYIGCDIPQLSSHIELARDGDELAFMLRSIALPSDLIREWLIFYRTKPTSNQLYDYLIKMEGKWEQRVQFVKEVDIVLT
ncbi:phosphotransferase [Virgibacillus senegalensis]|uniref:phosphotransferase n=1 Tax=Virgibacillus senegalensis TaxID=1499679 RepID=UPI00069E810B|nr:phosphotransferase [Virgibacillus senegalensis]